MLPLFFLSFFIVLGCHGTVVGTPLLDRELFSNTNLLGMRNNEDKEIVNIQSSREILQWQSHVLDFLRLIDLETLLSTAVRFIDDPEVMKFVAFLFSPKCKEIVWELETLEEFKEACMFLEEKGYDVTSVINFVNSGLNLPTISTSEPILRSSAGVNGFIAAMIGSLPLEEMKKLLNDKLENSPEVSNFVEVLNSPEFVDIVRRMVDNPKLNEFKAIFESYGVDFGFMCLIAEELFDGDYQGLLCKKNEPFAISSN